jgi:hypothetical protein
MSADLGTCDAMDEALRAKDAVERKFHARNMKGALRSAIKAQNLCPSLEGISQMVATLEVHLASELKINGESNWYRILSLSAFVDEEEVKKQYKRLAFLLHPDKNKSVGGEAAFKLVLEAWSVLSDHSRKMIYDQKRRDHSVMNGAIDCIFMIKRLISGLERMLPPPMLQLRLLFALQGLTHSGYRATAVVCSTST